MQHIRLCRVSSTRPAVSSFVPADQAFVFDFQQHQHDLTLNWQVKEGYYLYRQQIRVTPNQAHIDTLALPDGEMHEDEFYGKTEIYRQQLTLPLEVTQATKGATLTVTYQGCADAGFCYPPETKVVPLMEVAATQSTAPAPAEKPVTANDTPAASACLSPRCGRC